MKQPSRTNRLILRSKRDGGNPGVPLDATERANDGVTGFIEP
jgi:hypothetical protein